MVDGTTEASVFKPPTHTHEKATNKTLSRQSIK